MHWLNRKSHLYVKALAKKGQGLFCGVDINKNDVIEKAPAIFFNKSEAVHIDKTGLYDYYFSLSYLSDDQANHIGIKPDEKGCSGAVIFGAGSIANHSDRPNAGITFEVLDGRLYAGLKALVHIPAEQEICISYGELWFEPA